ncbi:MAG: hypothetical protein JWM05_3089 [Acidimicrobiales bacterium]|nr:hypothetical protein [Acidimicrobiales bacterium]
MGIFKKLMGGVDKKLLESGLPGRGVVVEVVPSGGTVQMGGGLVERVCTFRLQITLDNQAPFEATCKQRVAEIYLGQFQPGSSVVAVRVNPENHAEVAIDFNSAPPTVTVARDPNRASAAEILASGTPAKAVILENQALGMKSPDGVDLYAFSLTVMGEGRPPYQVQVGNPTPAEALPLLFPGSHVPVKLGPTPNEVVIDWTAALQQAQS